MPDPFFFGPHAVLDEELEALPERERVAVWLRVAANPTGATRYTHSLATWRTRPGG